MDLVGSLGRVSSRLSRPTGGRRSPPKRPITEEDPRPPERNFDMGLLLAVLTLAAPLRCQEKSDELHGLVRPLGAGAVAKALPVFLIDFPLCQ